MQKMMSCAVVRYRSEDTCACVCKMDRRRVVLALKGKGGVVAKTTDGYRRTPECTYDTFMHEPGTDDHM